MGSWRELRRFSLCTLALLTSVAAVACHPPATTSPSLSTGTIPRIVPEPGSLSLKGGAAFELTAAARITVVNNPEVVTIGETLAAFLRRATEFPFPVSSAAPGGSGGVIDLHLAPDQTALGGEGYHITVSRDSLVLTAATPAGLFRGTQTIRQLLPADIESEIGVSRSTWSIPPLEIVDQPRFAWRGAMLDVARHFFTVDEVEQYIDLLAMYKMNLLHLHLADDQGWRIQINSRPNLTAMGSLTQVGGGAGGFYTQQQYQDIVNYARARYITIVPEIDMPSHINAALIAYPELSCGEKPPGLYSGTDVGWSTICVDKDQSYALIDDVVREISAITPGPYFHVGGDEVKTLTDQQYIKFIERVQDIVNKYGKRMIGWEEISKANLKPTTLVQPWKSDSASVALKYGSKLVMSPSKRTYLDMKYNASTELGLSWAGLVEVNDAYDWDPAMSSPGVTEKDIEGVEAPMWSETLRNITAVEYLAMPRLAAIAEVAWTPQQIRDWSSFRVRVAAQARRWNYMGVNFYRSPQIPW